MASRQHSGGAAAASAGAGVPDADVFASLELFAADGDVCFAAGDCAAAVGYAPRTADSDVLRPLAWLVAADARARRHAARVVRAQAAGDFTRRYVSIDSVDLGDDAASSAADSDYSSSSSSSSDSDDGGDDVRSRGRADDDKEEEGKDDGSRSRTRRHGGARRREAADEEGGAGAHDQYDLIALMAAREDRERAAQAPAAKRARDESPGAAPAAGLWSQTRRSALLDSMLAATPGSDSSSSGATVPGMPAWTPAPWEATTKEEEDDGGAALALLMPPIGESLGDDAEAQREVRRRRHEKTIRCEVAARVQELLMPYYKARRFANKVWDRHTGSSRCRNRCD